MAFLTDLVTLIVAVNPFSKALLSSIMAKKVKNEKSIRDIINYSNLIGLVLIIAFAIIGPFIFKQILGVSDNALTLACGVSLVIFGINYLFKDDFFDFDEKNKSIMYLSIGTPMIVGPASLSIITLISNSSTLLYSVILSAIAISVNYIFMIFSYKFFPLTNKNENINYISIKLTGLFMLAVGIQFILNAFSNII